MNNTTFFELMGDINDKYFAENYDEPQHAARVTVTQKRGAKKWIIPVSIAAAACLGIGIAAPHIINAVKDNSINTAGSADSKTLRDWLALPHHAINTADEGVIFTPAESSDSGVILTFESDVANDIFAVDDCTVKYAGYANAPYLGYVVLVQFDNGLWGLYRNSYKCDDDYDTEISVKAGDKLKAGDRIGTMYPGDFKLLISAEEPSAELFTPKYPELAEWEKQHTTLPVEFHSLWGTEEKPEFLTENLGYRGFYQRFYSIDTEKPVYAVADGTVYTIDDYVDEYDEEIKAKTVVIKLDTDFETPLYAFYNYLEYDSLTVKDGDTVKEGDVIGNAFSHPMGTPPGLNVTISTTPYIPDVDNDGYIIPQRETILLGNWLSQPHHSIYTNEDNVTLTPEELSYDLAEFTIPVEGHGSRDVYAIADCTVTYVGYANAPYLGKVVVVDFGNGLYGMYRNPYKADDYGSSKITVSEGDTLKAGDKIGSFCPDGFKLVIGRGEFYKKLIRPQYPDLEKWESFVFTDPIEPDGVLNPKRDKLADNLGYRGWYRDFWYIQDNEPVYAIADGSIYSISDNNGRSKSVVIKLRTILDNPVYAIYEDLDSNEFTLNVGDKVEMGDVIGTAYENPGAAPVGMFLTISGTPYIPEMDEDGNIITSVNPDTVSLDDWLSQTHHAIDSEENGVTLTPAETADDSAVFKIHAKTFTDIYAADDCTVDYVGWANAPYLGKVAKVKFDNGLWGLYRISYKDNVEVCGFSVKRGDKLKAGSKIGTVAADGAKLLISEEEPSSDLLYPEHVMLAKWAAMNHTEPITNGYDAVAWENVTDNLGYVGWYKNYYMINGGEEVIAMTDGAIYAISEISGYAKSVTLKTEIYLGADIYEDIYVIYENLAADSVSVNVGDSIKEGDVIGTAYAAPLAVPPGFTVTISATPYIPEMDEDGNVISIYNQ